MTQTDNIHRATLGGPDDATRRAAYAIGLDLGGTSIKAGLVDAAGETIATATVPTDRTGGPNEIIDQLAGLARRLMDEAGVEAADVAGVGVGIPGAVDQTRGVVPACVNLPGWRDVPVRDLLQEATGLPAVVENDANVAAFGEFAAVRREDPEAGDDLVVFTLGTGVGGGIVLGGRPFSGSAGAAGEIGHLLVDPQGRTCNCGQHGCLETIASAPAVIRRTCELQDGEGEPTVAEIFERVAAGEAAATQAVDEAVAALAMACVSICRVLDPPRIILGGGMIEACPALADRVDAAFRARTWKLNTHDTPITPARLGNRAGLLGAAALAFDVAAAR